MESKQTPSDETVIKSSKWSNPSRNFLPSQPLNCINLKDQEWGLPSNRTSDAAMVQPFAQIRLPDPAYSQAMNPNNQMRISDTCNIGQSCNSTQHWDPQLILSNLSFVEEKVHQLQGIIHSIVDCEGSLDNLVARRQLATTDLTSIIRQLISTAGTLLPSTKGTELVAHTNYPTDQLSGIPESNKSSSRCQTDCLDCDGLIRGCGPAENHVDEKNTTRSDGGHDGKEYEDAMEEEDLPPGSYEVLQLEKEDILAPRTHSCSICGKGFKRDANLRMHMRGHGDQYKTPAALLKPAKDSNSETVPVKRYSCPYLGCKRNRDHKNFQPLKTILCVKNHYKRSHCAKTYICSKCNSKKFSIIADLKTHEKHCGGDKWLCSCGTTFSRKDKLFGHVALFQGHSPVLSLEEGQGSVIPEKVQGNDEINGKASKGFNLKLNATDGVPHVLEAKGGDENEYFPTDDFETCNLWWD